MNLKYSLGIMIIIATSLLSYAGFTEETKSSINQRISKDSKTYYFGLQKDSPPISYIDEYDNSKSYCNALIELLKKRITEKIEVVALKNQNRFTGRGNNGEKLDAECGPDTITTGRESVELSKNGRDGKFSKPFALTGAKVLVPDEKKTYFTNQNQSQLQELKLGIIKGTTTRILIGSIYSSLTKNFVQLKDEHDAIQKIKDGKIDAYFNDELILLRTLKVLQSSVHQKYSIVPELLSHEEYGIVVYHISQPKNSLLLNNINSLLEEGELKSFGDTKIKIFNTPEFEDFKQEINPSVNSSVNQSVNPSVKKYSNIIFFLALIIIFIIVLILLLLVNKNQINVISHINNHNQKDITETKNSTVKTILILAANPTTTSRLRLDKEVREIDAGLQRAKKGEQFDLKQRWAVRVQDVHQSLLDFKPQFVHFSGHGSGDDGLVLEDETGNVWLVDTQALASLFKLFASDIECVVLNACYSEVQASAIAQYVPYVIGMNKTIGDEAAIKFATGFYNALGAGESVEFAYKLGCNVIQLDGIPKHLTPTLKKKQ